MNKRTKLFVGLEEDDTKVDDHVQEMNTEGYKLVSVTENAYIFGSTVGTHYVFFWEKIPFILR